ncbi:RDD family protein [Roseiterribacter gracilis]|uniref:RDD domain-containing protein n=1 Tax=Roseiterribacter gracilis TaxID=2812848 RepID=A0A8S8XG39_9PROT|nr:hypothetical protein TMPK1_31680 [Rhodospirillales bacterium TMPK1]
MAPHLTERTIAGFWRRLAAAIVDMILVVAIGATLTLVLYGPLARLGTAAQFVGVAVFALYFGISESRWAGSPGKRLFGLNVVGRDGAHLSMLRATARAALFGGLFFFNGLCWFFEPQARVTISALENIGVMLMVAHLLLLAANFDTRQGLHDLAVRSYVVRGATAPSPLRLHWAPLVATAALVLALPVALQAIRPDLAPDPQEEAEEAQSIAAMRVLYARPDVVRAHVHVARDNDQPTPRLVIWAWAAQPVSDEGAQAAAVSGAVRDALPELAQGKQIQVRLIRSVQIGIFSYTAFNQVLTTQDPA